MWRLFGFLLYFERKSALISATINHVHIKPNRAALCFHWWINTGLHIISSATIWSLWSGVWQFYFKAGTAKFEQQFLNLRQQKTPQTSQGGWLCPGMAPWRRRGVKQEYHPKAITLSTLLHTRGGRGAAVLPSCMLPVDHIRHARISSFMYNIFSVQ